MVNRVKLTCPEVLGLKNPYDGKELVVVANICEGVVTYSAPDAFTVRKPQKTLSMLLRLASMRNGTYGSVEGDDVLVNPYDGTPMAIGMDDGGGVYLDGGFDPTVACMNLAEFVKGASCGMRILEEPPKAESVEHPGDMTPDDSDSAHTVVDEETERAAHEMVKAMGADKGHVMVGATGRDKPPAKKPAKKTAKKSAKNPVARKTVENGGEKAQ